LLRTIRKSKLIKPNKNSPPDRLQCCELLPWRLFQDFWLTRNSSAFAWSRLRRSCGDQQTATGSEKVKKRQLRWKNPV